MLRLPLLLALVLACLSGAFAPAPGALASDPDPDTGAHNLILIIGDGMPLASEIAASRYLYGADAALSFHSFPYSASVATWDVTTYNRFAYAAGRPRYDTGAVEWTLGYDPAQGGLLPDPDSAATDAYFLTRRPLFGRSRTTAKEPATDSASAATALATGVKTDDGNIAWAPGDQEDGALNTVFEVFRAFTGGAIGVVSTVPFSHATPAAFISHNRERGNYYAISHEIITRAQPEVVISGGHPGWCKTYMRRRDLEQLRRAPEYIVVEREAGTDGGARLRAGAESAAAQGKKLWGLFGGSYGGIDPPSPGITRFSENPALSDSALAALRVLSQDPDGFALLIEQGDIDGGNHNNDFAGMIGSMADLDRAVVAVLDFIAQPGDNVSAANTLVIVTADHANGHLRLVQPLGQGQLPRQEKTPAALRGYAKLTPAAAGSASGATIPVWYGKYMYPDGEVAYSTGNHTNELVSLYAWGDAASALLAPYAGAHYPGTRIIDNTDVFHAAAQWLLEPVNAKPGTP